MSSLNEINHKSCVKLLGDPAIWLSEEVSFLKKTLSRVPNQYGEKPQSNEQASHNLTFLLVFVGPRTGVDSRVGNLLVDNIMKLCLT